MAYEAFFDVDAVRADFPIFEIAPYGKKLVYLDSAASAQKPQQVLERMRQAYEGEYANVHRGLHYLANAATEAYESAREKVRAFLNAASTDEIIFTRSSTEAINLVAASFGLAHIQAGDEIILSVAEHHSNIVPWHFLRERKGAVLKWIDVDDQGALDMQALQRAFSPRTKIVAMTHMSNVLGALNPMREINALAHSHGVPVLVDGSQAAVHGVVDVRELDADFYVFTGHKLYGPTGIGVLYGKKTLLESLPPYMGGGEMIETVTREAVIYNHPPHRFEAGTPPIVQAIGLGAAIDYVNAIGRDKIHSYETSLAEYGMQKLSQINALRMIGATPGKGPIFSFTFEGIHAHDIATVIDRAGIAVRAGTHCAQPLLQRFGVTSTCRASLGLYSTKTEIDTLADALVRAQKLFM